MSKLREKTEKRMIRIVDELKTFARENHVTLDQAIRIQLIDSLRGISHRISLNTPQKERVY